MATTNERRTDRVARRFAGNGMRAVLRVSGRIEVYRGRRRTTEYAHARQAWERYEGEPVAGCPVWAAIRCALHAGVYDG